MLLDCQRFRVALAAHRVLLSPEALILKNQLPVLTNLFNPLLIQIIQNSTSKETIDEMLLNASVLTFHSYAMICCLLATMVLILIVRNAYRSMAAVILPLCALPCCLLPVPNGSRLSTTRMAHIERVRLAAHPDLPADSDTLICNYTKDSSHGDFCQRWQLIEPALLRHVSDQVLRPCPLLAFHLLSACWKRFFYTNLIPVK